MIVPFHVASYYSLGFGTASVESLVERAAALGLPAFGLCDHDSLAAQVRFHDLCQRRGMRPITGVELRQRAGDAGAGDRRGRVIVLARDLTGYRSLCRIVGLRRGGIARRGGPPSPVEAAIAAPDGVWILSDDPAVLERLATELGPEQLGVLVVRPGGEREREQQLVELAGRLGCELVADPEVSMLDPGDEALQLLVAAIRAGVDIDTVCEQPGEESISHPLVVRSPADMAALFADLPRAVAGNARITGTCRFSIADLRQHLALAAAAEESRASLQKRAAAVLQRHREQGRALGPEYDRRLECELEVIDGLGHTGAFLAAASIADAARRRGIPLAVRGSAVGSLVIHLLGISEIDPLERDLLFERFLSETRRAPPDIDLDVASDRRDELLGWAAKEYGEGATAMVGVHQRFQLRSALRLGLGALGAGRPEIERVAEVVARAGGGAVAADLRAAIGGLVAPQRFGWLPILGRLVGVPRLLALHPGGLLVGSPALAEHLPLERGLGGLRFTQLDALSVEHLGLVKIDVLGNRFLEQLAATARLAGGGLDETAIPPDDAATFARLDRAATIGCYQVETPAMRRLLEDVEIRSMEHCVEVLAMVRPGAGDARRFAAAGGPDPALIYDEDLMRAVSRATGVSLAMADELRRAMIDAGDDPQALAALEGRFNRLCARAGEGGRGGDATARAWSVLRQFAAYSFCKAHAWGHAVLAYRSVYLKEHFPLEYGCALLSSYGGGYPLRTIAADLIRSGVPIRAPSVVSSRLESTVVADGEGRAVRLGLSAIGELSRRTAQRLVVERARAPFDGLADLIERAQPTTRAAAALLMSGACDELPPLSPAVYPWLHQALIEGLRGKLPPQAFERLARRGPNGAGSTAHPQRRRYQLLTRIQSELRYLQMHLSAHPMEVLRSDASAQGCSSSAELRCKPSGIEVRFAGVLAAQHLHPLGDGRAMVFLTLEDELGLVEAVIEGSRVGSLSPRITTPGPYLIDGRTRRRRRHVDLVVLDLIPFHQRPR